MRLTIFLPAIVATVFTFAAQAASTGGEHNRYKWKDADGNVHYDDALTPAAVQAGYDVVNKNSMIVKHVDPPKSTEQLKAEQEAAAKQAAETKTAEEQRKRDQQLLTAYPSEQDLAHAQQAQLDSIDQEAHATQLSLESQEKSLEGMLSRAADLERTNKPVPPALKKQIDSQSAIVSKQKDYIASKQKERAEAAQRFADELAHYREVRAKTPAKQ